MNINNYMRQIGAKGGKTKGGRKAASSRANSLRGGDLSRFEDLTDSRWLARINTYSMLSRVKFVVITAPGGNVGYSVAVMPDQRTLFLVRESATPGRVLVRQMSNSEIRKWIGQYYCRRKLDPKPIYAALPSLRNINLPDVTGKLH
jgi:hypothetical protein